MSSALPFQSTRLPSTAKARCKVLGQYFTEGLVAEFMASMLQPQFDSSPLRILDAGAGSGVLTMAVVTSCLALNYTRMHAVLYEIDRTVLPHLEQNMSELVCTCAAERAQFTFEIRHEDFIKARPDKNEAPFHLSSINPPYFRYNSKSSGYAGATRDLFKGDPNIYASFMAVVAASLVPDGQMVAIVPRSFANGLYFKGFRHYINRTLSLERVHIFRARNHVFREASILQENIICSYRKRNQSAHIVVSTSTGSLDLPEAENRTYPTAQIIDHSTEHEIIRIPESAEEARILAQVEHWPSSFQKNGYFISTGPVVEHRTRDFIAPPNCKENSVPLLRMHNIRPFRTEWTGTNRKDARFMLIKDYQKHVSANQPYVILKRFSSKEEKRRLVAGVHDPALSRSSIIALENHLNYIGHKDYLDLCEAYGLAVLFNSTFMDLYFRCISGNTQVNATEIRLLRLPDRQAIRRLGTLFQKNIHKEQDNDILLDSLVGQTFLTA